MKKILFIITTTILFSIGSFSQNVNTNILSKLEGIWVGKGTAMSAASNVTMEWGKTLGNKFHKITYKMLISFNGSEQSFEGMGLYKFMKDGTYEGTWFDSGGEMHAIKSNHDGKILTSFWGKPGEKYGKTEYEFIDESTIEVRDATQNKDGGWRTFATSRLSKK